MWKVRAALCLFFSISGAPSSVAWMTYDPSTVANRLFSKGLLSSTSLKTSLRVNVDSQCTGDNSRKLQSRRELLAALLSVTIGALGGAAVNPTEAVASEVRAPIELLHPATRVKLYIDEAVKTANQKAKTPSDTLRALSQFFAGPPPVFMTADEMRLSRRYLEIDTSSAWQNARRKEFEARGAERGIDYTTPYDRFNTVVEQWGEQRQFQILRSRQRSLERSNAIRAALNAYTNNLVYGDAYQLNVQGDAKKALVRSDALPNVNAVVVSDLDLRDLVSQTTSQQWL